MQTTPVRSSGDLIAITPQMAITRQESPAEIWYVRDGARRYMVAVYARSDHVFAAECSCFTGMCRHLLHVAALRAATGDTSETKGTGA